VPDYTGSFSGSFSGSFLGNGSNITNINYNSLSNKPNTVTPFQGNSILANSAFRSNFNTNVKARLDAESVISSSSQLTTEFDTRYGNELGDDLISGSAQVKSLLPSGVISGSEQLPNGVVSSSSQVDVTSTTNYSSISQYSDGKVKTKLNTESVLSGSLVSQLPAGTISASSQITITESQISDLQSYLTSETDSQTLSYVGNTLTISNGNSVTIQTGSDLPDGLISGSVLRTLDGTGVLSGSKTQIPAGTVSSSAQITALGFSTTDTDDQTLTFNSVSKTLSISDGNSVDLTTLAGGGGGAGGSSIWATGSSYYKVSADLQVTGSFGISGIPNISASVAQAIAGNVLPSGTVSGSSQITINESQISDLQSYLTSLPSGTVSGSSQITSVVTNSYISASAASSGFGQGGGGDVSSLNTFTGSINTKVNSLTSVTSSYLTSVPSGTISSSTQITSVITGGDLDMGGRKVLFGNVYSQLNDLPSASTYHGMFAHVHSTGKGYFAHAGNWVELTNTSVLNAFTSSINTKVDSLTSATSSYLTSLPSGVVSSSNQITSVATASFVGGNLSLFDGNRTVSNTNLPSNVYNVNFGTSGSVSNFIEKIFFPNTVPTITTSGFTIGEFIVSGSAVGTVSATDAEGQSITFRTASSYTADKFRISSAGAITLNTKSTSSLNTDNTPSSGSHPFLVEAVDTFSGVGSKTIYIRVTPNTAPNWRQTSVGGSIVNRFTQSLNENSVAGNNKVRVYYTDTESDSIIIGSGSNVPSEFTITNGGTYIQLNQVTASLDFETTTKYEFVLTASDEHFASGDDVESRTFLPFQVAVLDNTRPTVNDQTLTTINENTANGTTVGSITATDPESDTITFINFTLKEAKLNAGSNITSSLGGASLYNPHSDPFQCSSGGVVTRKNGIYLNSDIANKYIYQVTVKDSFNNTTDSGLITIPISADASSAISDNWSTPYIIESAVTGGDVKISSNGRTGTSAQWTSAASQRWSVTSTNNLITVTSLTGSTTTLELGSNLSGSGIVSGQTIAVALTASEHGFETTKQFIDTTITVTKNNPPSGSYTHTPTNLNTNGGRSGSLLTTLAWTDTESDSINHSQFTLTDASGQLNAVKSGDNYLIQPKNNLSGSTVYHITGSIKDQHGFGIGTAKQKFTIAQSGNGSLSGDTTSYIIESGQNGNPIRDASGFNAGNQSQVTVSYSPNYNSQAVSSFSSSHPAVSINGSGQLSLAAHISGSVSGSGDTIVSSIGFTDQYGNSGTGNVTVNVFANQAPTLSFSNVTSNLTASISANTNLVNLTITDTESDTPFSASIADSGATLLKLVPQNANSSSYQIQNKATISSGQTIQYDIQVKDNFAKTTNENNRTVVIKDPISLVYGYGWNGGSAASETTAISSMGDVGGDGVDITSGSVIAHFQSGSIGLSSFANSGGPVGTVTLVTSSTLNTLSDTAGTGVSSLGYFNFSGGSQRLIILFASQSNQFGKPKTMYDGVPPDSTGTAKEYYVYAKQASIPGTIGTGVYYFDTETPVQGYSRWGMIFAEGENTNNSKYYVMPDTASAP
jgi:hypothetical protein